MLNNFNRNNFINSEIESFVEDFFAGDDIEDMKNNVMQTEIKNALSTTYGKVPKFNLKIYAYVYTELIDFPRSDMSYDTLTTNQFFINVHRLIKVKFHLHHSHITGKIYGYAHDFCNTSVIEKPSPDIPIVANNLFAFDFYYFCKAYVASAWCSKALNIGGTNLTQINFANISNELKLLDALKFYQKILADLASTISDQEKYSTKQLTEKFLNQHCYSSTIWPYLNSKKKALEIISEGKGIIPYELIITMKSFFIAPEKCFL